MPLRKLITVAVATAMLLALGQPGVYAQDVGAAASLGSSIVGYSQTTLPIPSAAQLAAVHADLKATLLRVGMSLDETLKQGQASQNKQFEHLEKHLTTLFKENFMAEQAREDMRRTGANEVSGSAFPRGECEAGQADVFASQLNETTERLRKDLAQTYVEYAQQNSRSTKPYATAQGIDTDKVDFFPEAGKATEEELKAMTEAAAVMADPVPTIPLSDAEKKLAIGEEYTASDKLRTLYLSTVRNVLSQRQAMLASKSNDDSLVQSMKILYQLYGNGTAPLQTEGGGISQEGFLDFFANLRYASPNWNNEIRLGTPERLFREQTHMQALQLKLQWEILKQQQMQTILLAQMHAASIAQDKETVNAAYRAKARGLNTEGAAQ